ncbi:hypothetical protein V757_11120 [Pelistega indica]|uniref:Zeta toxin domain-containing protein n=1 Tax=Pelistega indica TaxID=1414851 RepID=V8FTJ3_9BURK|nr:MULTISPECIES: zeta toxin family protein [Pelistega]ETD67609.1 hypothetical protein V757_11120 [Pelistega indica]
MEREKKAKFIILAGVNGSGKSTLFNLYLEEEHFIFINADNIAKTLNNKDSAAASILAGRLALEKIKEAVKNKQSFIFETTLTSKQSLNLMKQVKENGFEVTLNYVYLDSIDLSKIRVAHRVQQGGHNIQEDVLERRYDKSISNLSKAMLLADNIYIFDNSLDSHALIYAYEYGSIRERVADNILPEKIKDILNEFEKSLNPPEPELEM